MSDPLFLFPNLGAEEGDGWRRMASHPRVRAAARLWAALFRPTPEFAPGLSGALGRDGGSAAFELCDLRGLVPWLSTPEALALAREQGLPLAAAAPELVARVHDKAFALERARAEGLLPAELAKTAFALGPEELDAADTVQCRIEEEVARWPRELGEEFVLKPRFGTSGRGRLTGRDGRLDLESLRGNLPRFRERGGVVVEPWLERSADLSAQLWITPEREPRLLGTLQQIVTPTGVPIGHTGRFEPDGAVRSGSPWDDELQRAAQALGRAAAAEGYTGPCGLDAFSYRAADGRERFRAVVEWNARFTAGTSALGVLARARRAGLLERARRFHVGIAPELALGARIPLFADDSELGLWLGP
ncbi:MAG TPA: hypothetical protein VMR50_04375 [Myxococcota bacterium]|nr:hypothetical protein [Myxococcota bacterium]